jgi:biotin transport system substrate-specific component
MANATNPVHSTPRLSPTVLLRAQRAVSIAAFVVLLALAAQVRVPLPGTPVPVTLQTAVVLLCAFALRPGQAMTAVGAYLVLGFVAAVAGSAQWFFASFTLAQTATAGYLVGFFLAAGLVSAVRCRMTPLNLGRTLALGFLGSGIIFTCGVLWQAMVLGDLGTAVATGLAPFVLADVIKVCAVAALVQAVRAVGIEPRA